MAKFIADLKVVAKALKAARRKNDFGLTRGSMMFDLDEPVDERVLPDGMAGATRA